MTAAVGRIKKEIESLAPNEAQELFLELQRGFFLSSQDNVEEEKAAVEAEWAAEIDLRAAEVEGGKVELVSGEAFNRHVDRLFASRGLVRSRRA